MWLFLKNILLDDRCVARQPSWHVNSTAIARGVSGGTNSCNRGRSGCRKRILLRPLRGLDHGTEWARRIELRVSRTPAIALKKRSGSAPKGDKATQARAREWRLRISMDASGAPETPNRLVTFRCAHCRPHHCWSHIHSVSKSFGQRQRYRATFIFRTNDALPTHPTIRPETGSSSSPAPHILCDRRTGWRFFRGANHGVNPKAVR
jgi:hypothetical protein